MKLKRPLIFSAFICTICVIAVFYCKTAIFAAIIFGAIAVVLNVICFKNGKISVILLCIGATVFSLGVTAVKINYNNTLLENCVYEKFVINSSPYYNGKNFSAEAVSVSSNTLSFGDKVMIYYDNSDLQVGDTVFATVKIQPVKNNGYKMNLYSKNIFFSGYAQDFKKLSNESSVLCFLPKLRHKIGQILLKSPVSYQAKSVASAITVGDKNDLTYGLEEDIKSAGVSHVFVVSGMHLIILMGGLTKLLKIGFYNKRIYVAVLLFGVVIIALICGFTMSIIRAAVMYLLCVVSPIYNRDNDAVNSLGGAVCIILAFSPYAVFSVAFQLSVLSTLGILLLTDFISEKTCSVLRIKKRFSKEIVSLMSVTVAATVMTAPVCVYHFGYLSVVAIVTNLLITHAVTYTLLLNALGIVFGLILSPCWVSSAFIYLGSWLSEYSIAVIRYFANLPVSTMRLPRQAVVAFVVLVALLVLYKTVDEKYKYKIKRGI